MSSFNSIVFWYIWTTFPKCRLYYMQCCHTYGVFPYSIPLLCLFSSVASSARSRRSVAFTFSITIGTISVMSSLSRYEPYITYIVYRTIQSFHLETFIQFASSVNSHSIRFNTRLSKITTSSAVYEFGCCLNFYQTSEYCNNLWHIHIRYVRDCSIDNLYTYSMRRW